MRRIILGLVLTVAAASPAWAQIYADLVIHNGKILTLNNEDPSQFSVAQAVAILQDRIVAVGTEADVRGFAGPATRHLDLKGRTLMPGLIDTHNHLHDYGMAHLGGELERLPPLFWNATIDFKTKETGLKQVKGLVAQKKPGEWLNLSIDMNRDLPMVWNDLTLAEFDAVAPVNPVYINITVEQNHAKVNSRALDVMMAKYPKGLPGVDRDAKGRPTGLIRGVASATMYQEMVPQPPFELVAPIYEQEMAEWVAMGVTSISTRMPGHTISAFAALERAGKMPLRIGYSHQIANDAPDPKTVIARLGALEGGGTDKLWFVSVTPVNLDGIIGMGWGCIEKTYPRENKSFPLWRYQLFGPRGECTLTDTAYSDRDVLIGAIESGRRVAGMHVGGDRALNQLLDLLEEKDPGATIKDRRFAVDHCRFIDDAQAARAKKYGLMFSCAPKYVYSGANGDIGAFGALYGEELAADVVVPMRRLIDDGLRPVIELDTHGMYTFLNLEVLITRKDADGRVWGAKQRINRREALYAFTRWASRYLLKENEIGSIEVGKKADLIVLDRDYLEIPEEEISDVKVLMTMVGGKLEYTEQGFAQAESLPQVGFRGVKPWESSRKR